MTPEVPRHAQPASTGVSPEPSVVPVPFDAADLTDPCVIAGRYHVDPRKELGQGASSVAYEVADANGVPYALLFLKDPGDLERARALLAATARSPSPFYPRIRDVGVDPATRWAFYVLDLAGPTLREWRSFRDPDGISIARFLNQAAKFHLSTSAIRPRDIKPENVTVRSTLDHASASYGPIEGIQYIDLLHAENSALPDTEIRGGQLRIVSAGYTSPQIQYAGTPPEQADFVYAHGCVAYYLDHGTNPPKDPAQLLPFDESCMPKILWKLVRQAMDPNPANRPTWSEIRDVSDRVLRKLQARPSRAPILIAWAATAVVVLAVIALWAHRFLADPAAGAPEPPPAAAARGDASPADSHPLPAESPFIMPGTADWDEILRVHEVILEHRELLSALRFETVLLRLPELRSATATSWAQSLARAQEYIRGWYHELATVRSLHVVPLIDGTTVELWVERAEGDTVVGRTNTGEHHRIPATRIGASVFEDPSLDAPDQLRAVSATRGPNAALALAARTSEPPAEILYLLSAAYSAAGQELNGPSGVADTIDRELARPLPPRTARSPWPPFPGDPPRRLESPRHQFAVDNLAERLRATTAGFTEVSQAPWWETVERSSPDLMRMIRSLLGEARGWGLFLADQNDQLLQELPQTEAAKRSARRLAHELAADARDLLQLREQLHYSGSEGATFEIVERDRIVRGGDIRAATGDVLLIPSPTARWAGTCYIGLKANFTRRDISSCILAVLASGSVRIELSRDLRAVGLEPPFSTPLPVDPTEGEHVVELVFAGGKTAVLVDDHVAAILPVTYSDWPAVGVRHMDAEIKELREWAQPPE